MEPSCSAIDDKITAINKSIVCSLSPAILGERSSSDDGECLFLFLQQFNRSHWYCGYVEAGVAIALSLCVYPANAVALVNFYKKGVTPQFLMLASALVACRAIFATTSIISGIARFTDDFPLGHVGCVISLTGGRISMALSLWIFALISFERRISASSMTPLPSCNLNRRQSVVSAQVLLMPNSRLRGLATALAALTFLCVAINFVQFHLTGAITTVQVVVDGVKDGLEPVSVCVIMQSKSLMDIKLFHSIYGALTLPIPVLVIIFNYGTMWLKVHQMQANQHESMLFASDASLRRAGQRRRREELLVVLMGTSVFEFVICIFPACLVIAHIVYDVKHDRKALSFGIYATTMLEVVDSALNPFWSSFLRQPRTHKAIKGGINEAPKSYLAPFTLIKAVGMPHNIGRTISSPM